VTPDFLYIQEDCWSRLWNQWCGGLVVGGVPGACAWVFWVCFRAGVRLCSRPVRGVWVLGLNRAGSLVCRVGGLSVGPVLFVPGERGGCSLLPGWGLPAVGCPVSSGRGLPVADVFQFRVCLARSCVCRRLRRVLAAAVRSMAAQRAAASASIRAVRPPVRGRAFT
jgi:hypothetical protein